MALLHLGMPVSYCMMVSQAYSYKTAMNENYVLWEKAVVFHKWFTHFWFASKVVLLAVFNAMIYLYKFLFLHADKTDGDLVADYSASVDLGRCIIHSHIAIIH